MAVGEVWTQGLPSPGPPRLLERTEVAEPSGFRWEGKVPGFWALAVARGQRMPHCDPATPKSMCWTHKPRVLRRSPECAAGGLLGVMPGESRVVWPRTVGLPGRCPLLSALGGTWAGG